MKWNKYTSKIAIVVEMIEHTTDGKTMPVGFELPAASNIPIIDVGKNWTLEQLIAMSIIIGKVTCFLLGLSFCIDSMALMPRGVAAPLIPSIFAEMFIETYFLLSSERLFLPKILFIIGERSLESLFDNPLFSSIANSPIQIAYIAKSSSESWTALFEAESRPVKTFDGSNKQSEMMLIKKRKIQILFILKNMI